MSDSEIKFTEEEAPKKTGFNWGRITHAIFLLIMMCMMGWNAYNMGYNSAKWEYLAKERKKRTEELDKKMKELSDRWDENGKLKKDKK